MVDLYKNHSIGKELDLRKELKRTFFGAIDEVAKGRVGLLRVARRDAEGIALRCECRDYITDEPDKDFYCPHCLGFGFYWDEVEATYYQQEKGDINIFYLEDDVVVYSTDYFITLKLSDEGDVLQPAKRDRFYKILNVIKFRADNGRIEYVKLETKYEPLWSVWYGAKVRQHNGNS
jgi:hypothetical protein